MLESQNQGPSPDPKELSFEEAFTRLGAMVETLESGGLPLDEAAQLFEQGMTLVRRCGQLLEETELRIAEIRENADLPATPAAGMSWGDLEMPPVDEDWQGVDDLPDGD